MFSFRSAGGLALALGVLACGEDEPEAASAAGTGATPDNGNGGAGGEVGGGGEAIGGAPGGNGGDATACPSFASEVVSTAFGEGQAVGQDEPERVLGPPQGAGPLVGSLDVVSLGNGGQLVVAFGETAIVDGEGPDFIVFENAFFIGGDESNVFAELATVEVSADGRTWIAFSCDATEPPYGSCAGWHPVFANPIDPEIDPLDPAEAGGDAFDLADVGVAEARFVRVVDRPDLDDPADGVFDLDAVGVVHGECRR